MEAEQIITWATASTKTFDEIVTNYLTSMGYEQSKVKPCVFYKWEGEEYIIFNLHVDDSSIAATSRRMIDDLFRDFKTTIRDKLE